MNTTKTPSQTASSFLAQTKSDLSEFSFVDQNHIIVELVKSIRMKRAEEIQKQEQYLNEMKEGYDELDNLMKSEIETFILPEQKEE